MTFATALRSRDRSIAQQSLVQTNCDVDDLIADRDADPCRLVPTGALEHPERKILDRKVATGSLCRLNPGSELDPMRVVQRHRGGASKQRELSQIMDRFLE